MEYLLNKKKTDMVINEDYNWKKNPQKHRQFYPH